MLVLSVSLLAGCQSASEEEVPQTPLHSERGGIGVTAGALGSTPVPTMDARRSLAVTETAIVSQFTLAAVLNQLAAQSGVPGLSGTLLFRQLWDTQNPAPGQPDLPAGAHCTDNGNQLNGFPYPCRLGEGAQASATPPATVTDYTAVGLFNRFDLAPADGADCGEYRVVFALTKPIGRNFIIFEAVLPNPRADLGLEGCRPVANFWAGFQRQRRPRLARQPAQVVLLQRTPGLLAVVDFANYGQNNRKAGQVRTNMFIDDVWFLREFKLERPCTSAGCSLRFAPVTVKTAPFAGLFNASSTHPLASEFQTTFFPSQVRALATGDVNTFNYTVPDKYNAGGSDAQSASPPDEYVAQFQGNLAMRARIQTELTAMGSSLTPEQVVARAEALACAGCHQRSNGANLGGFSFPSSSGFVQSTEFQESGPEGQRFSLSPALTGTFLPHRLAVLAGFLAQQVDNAVPLSQSLPSTQVQTGQTFTASVTLKNVGTTVWKDVDGYSLAPTGYPWGVLGVRLASAEAVAEGQQKTFTFTATAPATAGSYTFQWRMQRDGARFGDGTAALTVEVVDGLVPVSCADRNATNCTATPDCERSSCCGAVCADVGQSCPIFCPPPGDTM